MTDISGLRAGIFSRGIRRIPDLEKFFEFQSVVYQPARGAVDVVLTWGNKGTGRQALEFAEREGLPLWRLEDGFFRSVGTGATSPPSSLILDREGIYYDARRPSGLERLLSDMGEGCTDETLLSRASSALQLVRREQLSKYNDSDAGLVAARSDRKRVLVVDQTYGDASVRDGLATEASFDEMVRWSLESFSDAQIVVKIHPEVLNGKKKGYLRLDSFPESRVEFETRHLNPVALLESVDHVVTATSQLGFEALCLGKNVTCFGMPFYAGWGLTDDRLEVPRRAFKRTLPELAAASWILYPRYVDPVTHERCELEDVLAHLGRQRSMYRQNAGRTVAVGISGWKQPRVSKMLGGPGSDVRFETASVAGSLVARGQVDSVVVWGQKAPELRADCAANDVPFAIMEDGFLRSASLGSDLTPPGSLVVDKQGVYYDATRPSRLETFLATHEFSHEDRARGRSLRELIASARISKYNVQQDAELPKVFAPGERRVLIVGQVDDDASMRLGAGVEASNGLLVRKVRERRPNARLIYKPHPDVLSGNRVGRLTPEEERLVDHVETDLSVVACLDGVDEVHTHTSLVGFEALMRGLPVCAYGMPFYAGWGLTDDTMTCSRRGRQLEVDDVVFAALVAYPRYYSGKVDAFVGPEHMVAEIASTLAEGREERIAPTVSRRLKRLARYLRGRWNEW